MPYRYQWTNKLEGMFKDVGLSKDLTQTFRKCFDTEVKCGLVFNVNVCTHGFWPSTNYTASKTPEAVKETTEQFEKFYHGRYAEREIQWRMDMGEAEVLVKFNPTTEVRLSVSSYQMAFLLVFNKKKIASFQVIDWYSMVRSCAHVESCTPVVLNFSLPSKTEYPGHNRFEKRHQSPKPPALTCPSEAWNIAEETEHQEPRQNTQVPAQPQIQVPTEEDHRTAVHNHSPRRESYNRSQHSYPTSLPDGCCHSTRNEDQEENATHGSGERGHGSANSTLQGAAWYDQEAYRAPYRAGIFGA
eukprot:466885-Amorphochlora_amoeboformis.AAC.1